MLSGSFVLAAVLGEVTLTRGSLTSRAHAPDGWRPAVLSLLRSTANGIGFVAALLTSLETKPPRQKARAATSALAARRSS